MANDQILGHVVVTDEVGAVELHWNGFVATGDAKRHPKDVPDADIARLLATARALESLSDQVYAAVAEKITTASVEQAYPEFTEEEWASYLAEATEGTY